MRSKQKFKREAALSQKHIIYIRGTLFNRGIIYKRSKHTII